MYQFKREPLTADEATMLANAAQTREERLTVWTLLDTGLRVAELANFTRKIAGGSACPDRPNGRPHQDLRRAGLPQQPATHRWRPGCKIG